MLWNTCKEEVYMKVTAKQDPVLVPIIITIRAESGPEQHILKQFAKKAAGDYITAEEAKLLFLLKCAIAELQGG